MSDKEGMKFLWSALILVSGCGKMNSALKSTANSLLPVPGQSSNVLSVSLTFTPGSYFLVQKDVGTNKDTVVFEVDYKADKTFVSKETTFLAGSLTSSYFHRKSGTFSETSGTIVHSVSYDSCRDLAPLTAIASGDKTNMINLSWSGSTYLLYSRPVWSLPSDVNLHLTAAQEDVGCTKF